MTPKISPDHLQRTALVYVRQSTMTQVDEHLESQRRQYALAETARRFGFVHVETIDEDLGRSGSGLVARPGFQRLVAGVCTGSVGAVFCLEASRLARNGRDWHHLIDLCALVGTVLVDDEGIYDPRVINDRLLLGLRARCRNTNSPVAAAGLARVQFMGRGFVASHRAIAGTRPGTLTSTPTSAL
jgi:hypothetical protein